jgi:hypothetical protein
MSQAHLWDGGIIPSVTGLTEECPESLDLLKKMAKPKK